MSDRRVEWIRAQLDATEAAAKAADSESWRATDDQDDFDGDVLIGYVSLRDADGAPIADDRSGALSAEDIRHIALHDPAAVLADVASKRALLEQFKLRGDSVRSTVQPSTGGVWDDLIRMLAEGFRHRPGYAEAMGG